MNIEKCTYKINTNGTNVALGIRVILTTKKHELYYNTHTTIKKQNFYTIC